MTTVSVIVPAFNAADTLRGCLTSLAAQTLRDIEVIVVDDGSTDATAKIVREFASHSAVAIRLVQQANGGRAAARNTGLAQVTGDFIGFVDADDSAEPAMYQHMLARAESSDADLVHCEYESFDAVTGDTINHYREGDEAEYGASLAERPSLLLAGGASVCNKLVRRSLFTESEITFPAGMDFEDLATAYRLAARARRIEKVSEVLYRYRQGHADSIMSARDERYLQIPIALDITNRDLKDLGLFDAVHDELEAMNFLHLIHGRYTDLFRTGERSVRHAFIDAAFAHLDGVFPEWRRSRLIAQLAGRPAKRIVSTHRMLLRLYTDLAEDRS